jgi:hypothetical protein
MSKTFSRARLTATVVVGLLAFTVGLSAAGTTSEPASGRERRGKLLRLDMMVREGGGGWWVAMETLSETGKTAEFDSTPGVRIGAELEIAPGFWLKANVGRSEPTLVVTTHDPAGGTDVVQDGTVRMTPLLLGFEFHPKQWRSGRCFWGLGIHYGWVRYSSLPSAIDAELESTERAGGFDARLDFRLGKSPWLAGVEFGGLFASPDLTDRETGITRSAHFEGVLWTVGLGREF